MKRSAERRGGYVFSRLCFQREQGGGSLRQVGHSNSASSSRDCPLKKKKVKKKGGKEGGGQGRLGRVRRVQKALQRSPTTTWKEGRDLLSYGRSANKAQISGRSHPE